MKFSKILFWAILLGCNTNEPVDQTRQELFSGRDKGEAIYMAEVPAHWKRLEIEQDLSDTKIPLCTFLIDDAILTIHNFPYPTLETRIPPLAQVNRWEQQIPEGIFHRTPFSHGGFGGFRLEAEGNDKAMIGYAMQLSPILFRALSETDEQLRADYTLKFSGTPEAIEKNRVDVNAFAISFEWISPIPYGDL